MTLVLKNARWTLPLLLISSSSISAENENETAKQAAEEYRIVLDKPTTVQVTLGEDYKKQITQEYKPPISNNPRQELTNELSAIFVDLKAFKDQPKVNEEDPQQLAKFSLAADFNHLSQVRGITDAAAWYAKQVADNPVTASEAILSAMRLARHVSQKPNLLSHLTKIDNENRGIDNLASIANQMTHKQREQLRTRLNQLPTSASLTDVIEAEQNSILTYLQTTLNDGIKEWDTTQLNTDPAEFPNGLRLAGIALLPDRPARISLHDTQANTNFWLEMGKMSNNIELIRVDQNAGRAWIQKDTQTAVIDLKHSTIQTPSVPIDLLYDVLMPLTLEPTNLTQQEKLETLIELGMAPETILEKLKATEDNYAEMFEKIRLALEESEVGGASRLNEIKLDEPALTMLPTYVDFIKQTHQNKVKMRTLNDGLTLLNLSDDSKAINDGAFSVNENDYQIEKTANGFRLIPQESISDKEQTAAVTFINDNY